jgi:transcription elongation GreA/GreB family factor
MTSPRKQHFIDELKHHYQQIISGAHHAEAEAEKVADAILADSRRRDDAKGAAAQARMAAGHKQRRLRALDELEKLVGFASQGVRDFRRDAAVDLGALVDVSVEGEDGAEERTLFLLPVGAGTELTGPGGDGFVSVATPASPVGRALRGSRPGDSFEVVIGSHDREWTVVDLC